MRKKLFEGVTQVEIQGESVLDLIELTHDCAKYRLLGFEKQEIVITDRRQVGLESIRSVVETGNTDHFAEIFCFPAKARIFSHSNGGYLVELADTEKLNPDYMLWIAVGMPAEIPVYAYVFYETEHLTEDAIAFFSLYRRPMRNKHLQNHFSARLG